MKFIQTSDIHIGECRSLEGYLGRHKNVLQQITDFAVEQKLPLIVPGDIFHTKNTTHEEGFLVDEWLGDLDRKQIPTIITAGNHDHLYGEVTQLDGYQYHPYQHVKIVTWKPKVLTIGDIGFICISWGGYKTEKIEKIVREKLPMIIDKKYRVVLLHECISGVKLDNGFIMPTGTKVPKIPEITYWAVGDIHNHQRVNVANGFYAGAPAQFKFDDKLPKGLIVVDLDHPSKQPNFYAIASKALKTVSSVAEIDDDSYYKIKGSFEEVIKANREEKVVKSELVKTDEDVLEYEKLGIIDGLPEFLAAKGIEAIQQQKAVEWVRSINQ